MFVLSHEVAVVTENKKTEDETEFEIILNRCASFRRLSDHPYNVPFLKNEITYNVNFLQKWRFRLENQLLKISWDSTYT